MASLRVPSIPLFERSLYASFVLDSSSYFFLFIQQKQMIYDYLHLYFAENNIEVTNFMVSTHFPKQNLEDMAATVQDLGLHPRGMLYVQDLDA